MKKVMRKLKRWPALLGRSGFRYLSMKRARPPYWVCVNSGKCKIFADDDPGVRLDYQEIIIEDQYGIFRYSKSCAAPAVIADIGANVGVFSRLCTLLFPRAAIFSYEPNPKAFEWLKRNSAETRIEIFPCAVYDRTGEVTLNTRFESTCGTMVDASGDLRTGCIAASQVAGGRPIDILKMDCEGSEWAILRDESLLGRTKDFFLEYHLRDGHTIDELRRLVEKAGHRILRIAPRKEYHTNFGFLFSTSTK